MLVDGELVDMAGAAAHIRVKGVAELETACARLRRDVFLGMRPELRKIASTVAKDAHSRALADISNIGDRWSQFRVGTTSRLGAELVYVAPKQRNQGGSPRHNLAFMLSREMQAALNAHQEEVAAGLALLVEESAAQSGWS